ncbi:MAG: sigma-54-dependent transcriptional regulator, partial [Oceanobacter sp.]
MTQASALIIDDETDIRGLIAITLERMNLKCVTAADFSEALALLEQGPYNFCITDMKLPDGDGLDLIRICQSRYPDMPVAMITAFGNVDLAVDALKAGAFDFVIKPIDNQRLRELVQSALKLNASQPTTSFSGDGNSPLLGQSPQMLTLAEKIRKVARTQAPVFIHGESGTGKELVARRIHQLSSRQSGPFIAVNCGAIPADLMESEFFGHTRGAFTGAGQEREGLFRAAQGGTLFLDEVADLPAAMQAKLLRAIQEEEIRPVGETKAEQVDVRVIAATARDLEHEIAEGRFR